MNQLEDYSDLNIGGGYRHKSNELDEVGEQQINAGDGVFIVGGGEIILDADDEEQ